MPAGRLLLRQWCCDIDLFEVCCLRAVLKIFLGMFGLASAFTCVAGISHDPELHWRTVHTPHFRIHFHDGLEPLAQQIADIAERVHERLIVVVEWQPESPTDIVLTDEVDSANGFTTPLPSGRIELWVAPMDQGLFDYGVWYESLIQHEYTHLLHLDAAANTPRALRNIFGRHPLLFPDLLQPDWIIEGYATYNETDKARGIGRGQSSYFDMLMRMEAQGGLKPLSQVNQSIVTWPAGDVPYLYGVQFMQFVAGRYDEPKLQHWINRYRANLIPFMINTNARRVFGAKLQPMWDKFQDATRTHYNAQLGKIAAAGVAEGERMTFSGYRTGQTLALPDGTLFFIRADGRSRPALMRMAASATQPQLLTEVANDAHFSVDPAGRILVAQPEILHNARLYYDLYRWDEGRNELRRLTHGARYRHVAWLPAGRGMIAVRQDAGQFSLDQLDENGDRQETLWQGSSGEIVSGIDVSTDGDRLVTVRWDQQNGWQLAEFVLSTREWSLLRTEKVIPLQPRYVDSAKSVVFSADYDGVFNVQLWDRATRQVKALTNVRGGAFSPSITRDGTLFYTGYTPYGYDAFRSGKPRSAERSSVAVASVPATSVAAVGAPTNNYAVTGYEPAASLAPTWWSPIWTVTDDINMLGGTTSGSDPLDRHNYALLAAYDTRNDYAVGAVDYAFDGWWPVVGLHASRDLSFSHNSDADLTRIGSVDRYRANVALPFLQLRHRSFFNVAAITENERDLYVAPGILERRPRRDRILGIGVSYKSTERAPLAISLADGRNVLVTAEDSDVFTSDYRGQVYTADWREYLRLVGEHVLYVRGVVGWGDSQTRSFQLGGVGSVVESGAAGGALGTVGSFNRRDYPLRGYSGGQTVLFGQRMDLATIEWRFPLRRVERGMMVPPLGLDQVWGKAFVDAGAVWNGGTTPGHHFVGLGAELVFDARLFYRYQTPVVLGAAYGLDKDVGDSQLYVRVGANF